jgi:hypothetical protein
MSQFDHGRARRPCSASCAGKCSDECGSALRMQDTRGITMDRSCGDGYPARARRTTRRSTKVGTISSSEGASRGHPFYCSRGDTFRTHTDVLLPYSTCVLLFHHITSSWQGQPSSWQVRPSSWQVRPSSWQVRPSSWQVRPSSWLQLGQKTKNLPRAAGYLRMMCKT